jgi:ribonucleoside-diphosphate reductase alpha chain
MKSLYYCRSKSIQRAEDVSTKEAGFTDLAIEQKNNLSVPDQNSTDYDECLACQ